MKHTKERRQHIRIPLLESTHIGKVVYMDDTRTEKFLDITRGGCFIETEKFPRPGEILAVAIELPGDLGELRLTGDVLRVNWSDKKKTLKKGFAIRFYDMSDSQGKIFDAYLTYLRNKQIINVSKRIIEEFFGQKPRF